MTEDEMVGWHHQLDGRKFEQVLGVGDGHGSLSSAISWSLLKFTSFVDLNCLSKIWF